jgi:hypothetical protein
MTAPIADYAVRIGIDPSSDLSEKVRRELNHTETEVHGFFERVKVNYGRRSLFGEVGELFGGAGIVAGVSILGNELAKTTGEVTEFVDKIREGGGETSILVEQFVEGLPLIGGFARSIHNIADAITAERVAAAEANEQLKRQDEYFHAASEEARIFKDVVGDAEDRIRRLDVAIQNFGRPSPIPEFANIEDDLTAKLRQVEKDREAGHDKLGGPALAAQRKLDADAKRAQEELSKAQESLEKARQFSATSIGGAEFPVPIESDNTALEQQLQQAQQEYDRAKGLALAHQLKWNDESHRIDATAAAESSRLQAKAELDKTAAADKTNRDINDRVKEQMNYLAKLQEDFDDARSQSQIAAMDAHGDKLAATLARINDEINRQIRDANKDFARQAFDDDEIQEAARKQLEDYDRFLDTEQRKSKLDKATADFLRDQRAPDPLSDPFEMYFQRTPAREVRFASDYVPPERNPNYQSQSDKDTSKIEDHTRRQLDVMEQMWNQQRNSAVQVVEIPP